MLPDRVSNPGPLTYESDALPIALRGPAISEEALCHFNCCIPYKLGSYLKRKQFASIGAI